MRNLVDPLGTMPLSNLSGIEHGIVPFLPALFTKQGNSTLFP